MRTKVTLVLVFLNVALFFFIFYVRPRWVTVDQLREARQKVLPSTVTDIQAIEISGQNQSIRLARHGERWHIEQPVDWVANPHAVSRILTELQTLKHDISFEIGKLAQNKIPLSEYGLDKPVLTVTITPRIPRGDTGGQPVEHYTLRIGNPTNVGNRLYVLSHDGQRVHVVSKNLIDSLGMPLEQLRDPSLFSIRDYEARSLNIQSAAPSNVRIHVRREGDRWSFETPVIARANTGAVLQTIGQLGTLKVGSFLDQQPAPELNPATAPVFRITIGGNNRSETLLIGGLVPGQDSTQDKNAAHSYYAQVDGRHTLFTLRLSDELIESLRSAQTTLRETRILEFETQRVSSVILRAPNQEPITLQRLEGSQTDAGDQWQIIKRGTDGAPIAQAADRDEVQRLLGALERLSAQRFLTDAPTDAALESWGFNSPERSIVVQTAALSGPPRGNPAPTLQTLQIGVSADRGPRAYAKLESARSIYEIDAEILNRTPVDAKVWRDRHLRDLPAGAQLSSVKIIDLASGKVLLDSNCSGTKVQEPPPPAGLPESRRASWQTLLGQLRSLRARSFVSERYTDAVSALGDPRPWRLQLEIGVTLSGGADAQKSIETLVITDRIGGSLQIAGAKHLDCVFELPQPFIDALWDLTKEALLPGSTEQKP